MTGARAATKLQWQRLTRDRLFRNSVLLLVNMGLGAVLGFAFWTVAARTVSAAAVGVVTASMSAATLLTALACLGLPNALIRFLPHRPQARATLVAAVGLTQAMGLTALVLTSWTPIGVPLLDGHRAAGVVAALVLFQTLVLTVLLDAALLAGGQTHLIVVKTLIAGLVRIAVLPVARWLTDDAVLQLAWAQAAGFVVAALLSVPWLVSRWQGSWTAPAPLRDMWGFVGGNYAGTLVGVLPSTVTPLIVLHRLGAEPAAYFGVAMMLLSLLHMLPSAMSQSLFAASAHGHGSADLRRAARGLFGVLVPAVAVVALLAPPALGLFGPDYAARASAPLRLMAAGALAAAVNYLVDAQVNGRGDARGYLFLNVQNAALVLTLVLALSGRGLVAVALGWTLAQVLAAVVALAYLRLGPRPGRPLPAEPGTGRGPVECGPGVVPVPDAAPVPAENGGRS